MHKMDWFMGKSQSGHSCLENIVFYGGQKICREWSWLQGKKEVFTMKTFSFEQDHI